MQVSLSKTKVSNVLYYRHIRLITPINSSYIKDFYNSISKINRNLLSFDFALDNFTKSTVKIYLNYILDAYFNMLRAAP